MSEAVEILFLGTGTSAGVPMIGCRCRVCTSPDPKDKRTRPSVVITAGGMSVLVDTTPELRLQCLANDVRRIDAIVFTHAHADHIMGLDDVRRFNTILGRELQVFADDSTFNTLERCFGYAFRVNENPQLYRPQLLRTPITGPFDIGEATWRPIPLVHGSLGVLGFRVNNAAYCTDASAIPDKSWPLLEGLDLLVLDALQDVKHPTHFTFDEALEVVRRVKPKRTFFTHMSHRVLHAETDENLPAGVSLAFDGLRVSTADL